MSDETKSFRDQFFVAITMLIIWWADASLKAACVIPALLWLLWLMGSIRDYLAARLERMSKDFP